MFKELLNSKKCAIQEMRFTTIFVTTHLCIEYQCMILLTYLFISDSPSGLIPMGNPSTLLYGENCPVRAMSLASEICRVVIICKTVYDS